MRVPFPSLSGLPFPLRRQIERNFAELESHTHTSAAVSTPTEFDAVVDNSLAVSVPATMNFKSIHEAINYCGGTLAMVRARLLVRNTGTNYSESTTLAVGTLRELYIKGEGTFRAGSHIPPSELSFDLTPVWSLATDTYIRDTSTAGTLVVENMKVISAGLSGGHGMFEGWLTLVSLYSQLGNPANPTAIFESAGAVYNPVAYFLGIQSLVVNLMNTTTAGYNLYVYMFNCGVLFVDTGAKRWPTKGVHMEGCHIGWTASFTLTCAATDYFRALDCTWSGSSLTSTSGSGTMTLSLTGGGDTVITGAGPRSSSYPLAITLSSRPAVFVYDLSNNPGSLTLPAFGTPATAPGRTTIRGSVASMDVNGPATIDVSIESAIDGALTLRGPRIVADVSLYGNTGSTVTLFKAIAMTDSLVRVASRHDGAGAVKAYALDGTSDRNIIDFAGQVGFPTASTDAGAGNVIRVT